MGVKVQQLKFQSNYITLINEMKLSFLLMLLLVFTLYQITITTPVLHFVLQTRLD